MEEVKNNSGRFIGETTKYQINKFNKETKGETNGI